MNLNLEETLKVKAFKCLLFSVSFSNHDDDESLKNKLHRKNAEPQKHKTRQNR